MGEAGVRLCLEIIAKELSVTMGFCGVVDINAVDSSALIPPPPIPEMTDGADIGGLCRLYAYLAVLGRSGEHARWRIGSRACAVAVDDDKTTESMHFV
jgi:hypothetical protein